MILFSTVGCQTSVTASQISSAKSSSVLVQLSGEYSKRTGVPAAAPGSAETSSTFYGALPVTVTGCGANSSRWKVRVSGSKTAKRIAGVICLPGRRGTKV